MTRASVSVIIPCFNAQATIQQALDSVRVQTQPVLELICVDDASTDNTLHIIQQYAQEHPDLAIQILRNEKNQGPSVARNRAWDIAKGDYIAFLDADDVWHPRKIELQYTWMREHPEVLASGHRYLVVDPGAMLPPLSMPTQLIGRPIMRNRLLLSNPFVTPSVMLKRDLSYRFDPKRRYCEDYYLWLQLACDGLTMVMLETPLVYVRKKIGASGASRHLWQMRWGDIQNYWQLWHSNKLGFFPMSALVGFSILKFLALLLLGPQRHFSIKQRIDPSVSR
ncbi:MAG: glycosyltransferase [candidate division KSB1 bacterium]|nr:glycosyltransferase [candidate division KSB1 bacterium]